MTGAELAAVLSAVTLVVAGQVTLKRGMDLVGPITRSRLRSPLRLLGDTATRWQVWLGVALYVTSAAAWIYALSTVPLSVAYPFLGLTYVGVAAVAVARFGEWLTPAQWIGIALVVVGVVTVALTAG